MKFRQYLGIFVLLLVGNASGDDVHVAVASNFSAPMKTLIQSFEATHDDQVRLSTGSSGKLYAQIHHGAPFQLFFSADRKKPQLLEEEGYTVKGTRFTYAVGKLVLWSAKPDVISGRMSPRELLQQPMISRIALANPRLAPYGQAAVEVLQALGLEESTRDRWVMGENIAQTYQFVQTGNADIGFVALSQLQGVTRHKPGSYHTVSDAFHSAIRQDVVMLKKAEPGSGARAFLTFIRSPQAQRIIESYGYDTIDHENHVR